MIQQLHITNYKSLHDLSIECGRFNVLIGENGCGKSNVLEAIALAAAAAGDKLDNEFLVSRGIRVTEPQLMRAAFSPESQQQPIRITVGFENVEVLEAYTLTHSNEAFAKWGVGVWWPESTQQLQAIEQKQGEEIDYTFLSEWLMEIIDNRSRAIKDITYFCDFIVRHYPHSINTKEELEEQIRIYDDLIDNKEKLQTFVIYSPENTALRNFQKEGQIEPLGINGEGLLKLLQVIHAKSPEQREEIHTSLQLFDWYSELEIPETANYENKVTITDRYLSSVFDQRSANEGFLLVLFYIALMVSDDTPEVFAIDNIDVALNPKLCTKLIKELIRLAKKYHKQVFVTTHNPAILDGIDLADDDQRLLVLSRNKQGYTRFKRITLKDKPRSSSNEPVKLSEAFLRGYLGGLPKGF